MYANIIHGLEAKECSEATVVGSCIQLLLSGSAITRSWLTRRSSKEVAKKLKDQRKRGIVKDQRQRAIQILVCCYLIHGMELG